MKKTIEHNTISTNKVQKKIDSNIEETGTKEEVKDDSSWESLIAFEKEFKKRSKIQKEESRKRAEEEKRKMNITLGIIVFSTVAILVLLSYFEIDNANLMKNTKFFFSK